MGTPKRRTSDRAGRPAMRSPGRPPAGRREHRQRFWVAIARGSVERGCRCVKLGVSEAVGVRWFREAGGMPSVTLAPLSGRYLSFAEREEIALLRAQRLWACGRSPSARSLAVDDLAGAASQRRDPQRRSRVSGVDRAVACGPARRGDRSTAKLAANAELRRYVQDRLSGAGASGLDGIAVDGSGGRVDRSASRPAQGPALGQVVEPGADLQPAAPRLPG